MNIITKHLDKNQTLIQKPAYTTKNNCYIILQNALKRTFQLQLCLEYKIGLSLNEEKIVESVYKFLFIQI